jgi:hypothetical protein
MLLWIEAQEQFPYSAKSFQNRTVPKDSQLMDGIYFKGYISKYMGRTAV